MRQDALVVVVTLSEALRWELLGADVKAGRTVDRRERVDLHSTSIRWSMQLSAAIKGKFRANKLHLWARGWLVCKKRTLSEEIFLLPSKSHLWPPSDQSTLYQGQQRFPTATAAKIDLLFLSGSQTQKL